MLQASEADRVAQQLDEACTNVGFFYIKNHGGHAGSSGLQPERKLCRTMRPCLIIYAAVDTSAPCLHGRRFLAHIHRHHIPGAATGHTCGPHR
jgi:hypothetical protein